MLEFVPNAPQQWRRHGGTGPDHVPDRSANHNRLTVLTVFRQGRLLVALDVLNREAGQHVLILQVGAIHHQLPVAWCCQGGEVQPCRFQACDAVLQ